MDNRRVYQNNAVTRKKVAAVLSPEERRQLTRRSDLWGAASILLAWGGIAASFALVGWGLGQPVWLMIPVVVLGVALLGGRQLALAILTHEGTHNTLFRSRWANSTLTDWLCGRPIGLDLARYRTHHFIHHSKTGTAEDSDISLIQGLPTTRASLARKFLRDLSGLTGLKFLLGRLLMDMELMKWTVATEVTWLPRRSRTSHLWALVRNSTPAVLVNGGLLAALWLAGQPGLYLAWVAAYLIPYPLFIRIRALAEHAGTEATTDMFRNTRTTRAGWLARLFFAPFRVNYHIEHHAMAAVPWYRLKALHALLRQRQMVAEPPGYWQVMRLVSSAGQTR